MLKLDGVCKRYQVTAVTIWRWRKAGIFPNPIKIGKGVRWREEDLDEFDKSSEAVRMCNGREQLTPKYWGIFDKAMAGHSKTAAIHAGCLICVGCDTKAIKNCGEQNTCPFWPYRPYQDKPKHRSKIRPQITDKKGRFKPKPKQPGVHEVIVPNVPAGDLRLKVVIENIGVSKCLKP